MRKSSPKLSVPSGLRSGCDGRRDPRASDVNGCRGDLIEIGDPGLVGIQKALIRRARQLNRSVITRHPDDGVDDHQPDATRAGGDTYNAVLDGTDAVMLSAETAAGRLHPSETGIFDGARVWARKNPSLNVANTVWTSVRQREEAIAMSAMPPTT